MASSNPTSVKTTQTYKHITYKITCSTSNCSVENTLVVERATHEVLVYFNMPGWWWPRRRWSTTCACSSCSAVSNRCSRVVRSPNKAIVCKWIPVCCCFLTAYNFIIFGLEDKTRNNDHRHDYADTNASKKVCALTSITHWSLAN